MIQRKVLVRLELPVDVHEAYECAAADRNMKIEDVMSDRLAKRRSWNAHNPLYFDDSQRAELERILGSHRISNAEEALVRIKESQRINVAEVPIQLREDLLGRIRARYGTRNPQAFSEWFTGVVNQGLHRFVNGQW